MALSEKQKRFCERYILHLNASRAAREAGYAEQWAGSNVDKLLKNTEIQARIDELKAERAERAQVTPEEVLAALLELWRESPEDMYSYDEDGTVRLRPSSELSRAQMNTIAGIEHTVETRRERDGTENTTHKTKLKHYSRDKALEMTMRHLALFNDKLNIQNSGDLSVRFKGLPSKPEPEA
jgi:phage terminase small subunit